MTTLDAIRAWLAVWDQRQRQLDLRLEAWRDGWRAAEIHYVNAYERGHADGCMALKAAQHDTVRLLQDEAAILAAEEIRWGPGGRHHFADPRPGDYPGKQPPNANA